MHVYPSGYLLTGRESSLEGHIYLLACLGDSCGSFQRELGILHSIDRAAQFSQTDLTLTLAG